MTNNEKQQCQLIANHYGEHSQLGIMIEECAELIQAISKMQRYGEPTKRLNYVEELADVSIMTEQLVTLLNATDYERFERFVEYKLNRQKARMEYEDNV